MENSLSTSVNYSALVAKNLRRLKPTDREKFRMELSGLIIHQDSTLQVTLVLLVWKLDITVSVMDAIQ